MGIKASEQIINKIKEFEGFKQNPYPDAKTGKFAVGYGDTRSATGPVSKEEADIRLRKFIQEGEKELSTVIKRADLSQNRQDMLIDTWYNLGLPKMKSLVDLVNSGDDEGVGRAILEYVNTTDAVTKKKYPLDALKKRAAYRAQLWNSAEVVSPNPFDKPATQADAAPGAFIAGDDFAIDLDSIVNEVAPPQEQPTNALVVDDYFLAEMDDIVKEVVSTPNEPQQPQDPKAVLDAASDATFRESSSQWLMRRSEAERISKKLGIGLLEARDLLADSSAEDILARNANALTAQYFPAVSQWAKNPDNYVLMKKTGELPHRIELKTKALNTDSDFVKALKSNEVTLKRQAVHLLMNMGKLDLNTGKRMLFELDQQAKEFKLTENLVARQKLDKNWNDFEQGLTKVMNGQIIEGGYESMTNLVSALATYAGNMGEWVEEGAASASSFAPLALNISAALSLMLPGGIGIPAAAGLKLGAGGLSALMSFGSRMDDELQDFARPDGSIDYDKAFSDPEINATRREKAMIYAGGMAFAEMLLGRATTGIVQGKAVSEAAKEATKKAVAQGLSKAEVKRLTAEATKEALIKEAARKKSFKEIVGKTTKIGVASTAEESLSEFGASTITDAYVGEAIQNLPKNITAAVREGVISPGFLATGAAISNGSIRTLEVVKKNASKRMADIKKSAAAKDRAETLKSVRSEILSNEDAKQNKGLIKDLVAQTVATKQGEIEIFDLENEEVSDKEIEASKQIDNEGTLLFSPSDFDEFVKSKGFDPEVVVQGLSPEVQDQYFKNKESDSSVQVTVDEWLTFQTDDAIEGIDDIARFPDVGINAKEAAEIVDDVISNPVSFMQSAYHGSPYRFDKFSTAAIGTGEGAQAFGYGLYFTEDKDIAEWYREKLAREGGTFTKDGKTFNASTQGIPTEAIAEYFTPGEIVPGYASNQKVLQFIPDTPQGWVVQTIAVDAQGNEVPGALPRVHSTRPDFKTFKKVMESRGWETNKGQTYQVEIPEQEQMLDWEETYSKQSEYVKDKLNSVMKEIYKTDPEVKWKSGESFYKAISNQLGSDKKASNFLKSKGIKGIQYPAQGGKSDKKNFVIFEDRDVEIVRSFYQTSEEDLPPPIPGQIPTDVQQVETIEPMQIIEPSQAEGNIVMRPIQLLSKYKSKKEMGMMKKILSGLKKASGLSTQIPKEALDALAEIQYSHTKYRAEALGMRVEELLTLQYGKLTDKKDLEKGTTGKFINEYSTERVPYALTRILIAPDADLSTVTHELGHAWLHDMARDSATIMAIPEDQITDQQREYRQAMKDTAELFNLNDISDLFDLSNAEQERIHETFAQTAERYFYEGKFENNRFRQVLEHFRQFLKRIAMSIGNAYKQYPPFKINPKIERIFETILGASDKVENTLYPMFEELMFDPKVLGADAPKYVEAEQEARSEAMAETYTKMFLKSDKERQQEALARLEEFRTKATNDIDAQPVFQFYKFFRDQYNAYAKTKEGTDPRLSFNSIAKVFFNGDEKLAQQFRDQVPFEVMASKGKGGIDVAQFMADNDIHDFNELMNAMLEMSTRDQKINDAVDAMIDEAIPQLKTDEEIHRIAQEAVQNKGKEKLLQLEMKILAEQYLPNLKSIAARLINPAKYIGKDAKEDMKREGLTKVMLSPSIKFTPEKFLIDSDKKGKSAAKNFKSNDIVSALNDKYQQIIDYNAYKQAQKVYPLLVRAAKDTQKIFKYAGKKSAANRYDLDVLNQAKRIITQANQGAVSPITIDFISDASGVTPDMIRSLNDKIEIYNERANGRPLAANNIAARLTYSDLVRSLLKTSAAAKKLEIAGIKENIDTIEDAMLKEMDGFKGTLDTSAVLNTALTIDYAMETLIGKDRYYSSTFFQKLLAPIRAAEAKATEIRNQYKQRIQNSLKKLAAKDEGFKVLLNPIARRLPEYLQKKAGVLEQPIAAPELGITFKNKGERLTFMLLMGSNSGAAEVMLRNTSKDVSRVIDPTTGDLIGDVDLTDYKSWLEKSIANGDLTIEEINFVNEMWDIFEELHPQLEQTMRETDGIPIGKIAARKVVLNVNGQEIILKGGYAPIKADRLKSAVSDSEYLSLDADGKAVLGLVQTTNFTKERTGGTDPIDLNIARLSNHVNAVVNVIHMRKSLSNFRKVMLRPSIRKALNDKAPGMYNNIVVPFFANANKQVYTEYSTHLLDRLARHARKGVNMVTYALNVKTALKQQLGLLQSIRRVEPKHLYAAIKQSTYQRRSMKQAVLSKSSFMQSRWDVTVRDAHRSFETLDTNFDWVTWSDEKLQNFASFLSQASQNHVDLVTWTASYNQELSNGRSEQEAIAIADDVVMRTQGSMAASSLSNLQTGADLKKLFLGGGMNIAFINLNEIGLELNSGKDNLNKIKGVSSTAVLLLTMPIVINGYFELAVKEMAKTFGLEDEEEEEEKDPLKLEKQMAKEFVGTTIATALPYTGRFIESYMGYGNVSAGPISNIPKKFKTAADATYNRYQGVTMNDREVRAVLDMLTFMTGTPLFSITGRGYQVYSGTKSSEELAEERYIRRYQLEDLRNEVE